MAKKSQIQSQILIYLFAIVIISMILLFGIKAISSFKKDTDRVSLVNFEIELKTFITAVSSEYDSVQKGEFFLPSDYKQVCFADKETKNYLGALFDYPLIYDSISSNTTDNVFIVKDATSIEQFQAGDIVVDNPNHFLCIENTRGNIIFTAKGKSKYSEIRR